MTDRADFMTYILRDNDERGVSVPEVEATSNAIISDSVGMSNILPSEESTGF